MSVDPRNQTDGRDVDVEADELVVEALLASISPREIESQERRIVLALEAISNESGLADSSSLRITEADTSGSRSAILRWKSLSLSGVGAGLAAMFAVALILLARPGENQASAATWLARAEAAATRLPGAVRGYVIEINPHSSALDSRRLRGRLALQEVGGAGPLVRLDIDEPSDRRHSIGVDSDGGWHRRSDDSLREFPGHAINERFVIPGLDLLLDPLPGFYDRVKQDYELVEIVESPQPRLVARHRDLDERDPRAPDRIEILLDPEDWSLKSVVLGWDEPVRPSRQAGRGPGPGGPDRSHRRRPPGSGPDARSHPGASPVGPPSHGRPGPPRGRNAPPPPEEIMITRIDHETGLTVSR
ncbi:MAG: hypothetical protein GY895_14340 [Phycisphaera sp.]|nr:hypothetical protein [Phycisphaera sp.]